MGFHIEVTLYEAEGSEYGDIMVDAEGEFETEEEAMEIFNQIVDLIK